MCDISQSQETLSVYSWGLFLLIDSSAFNVQISGRKVVCGARTEQLETLRHSLCPALPWLGGLCGKLAGHLPEVLQP